MADLINESFEAVGYEESFAGGIIDSGCSLDPNSALPALIPGESPGTQCLKTIVIDATNDSAFAQLTIGTTLISYVSGYIYLSEEGLGEGEEITFLQLGAGNISVNIHIKQVGSNLELSFMRYSNTDFLFSSVFNMFVNRWYKVEYKYDITNLAWEFRVNEIVIDSGSLVSATRTPTRMDLGVMSNQGSSQLTLYQDKIVLNDSEYPPVAGAVVCCPTLRRLLLVFKRRIRL